MQGAPFDVAFADGSKRSGFLDPEGKAVLKGVPPGKAKVHYGEDTRKTQRGKDDSNPLLKRIDK